MGEWCAQAVSRTGEVDMRRLAGYAFLECRIRAFPESPLQPLEACHIRVQSDHISSAEHRRQCWVCCSVCDVSVSFADDLCPNVLNI